MTPAPRLDSIPAEQTQTVLLPGISWQTYQAMLAEMGDHRATRLTYDQGWLQIKMPSKLHEIINRLLARIVTTLTEELDLEIVNYGSTTLNRADLARGAEPDTCFYIQNAPRVQGLDPAIPSGVPPDLVIEVDITSPATRRMGVYLALEIPEVWCYTCKQGVQLFEWAQQPDLNYLLLSRSKTFPLITPEKLNALLRQRQSQSENAVIRDFRQWIRESMPA
ncbi:MAG: Uma2 family endonuclease [Spirulinaceae cyanobacterium]